MGPRSLTHRFQPGPKSSSFLRYAAPNWPPIPEGKRSATLRIPNSPGALVGRQISSAVCLTNNPTNVFVGNAAIASQLNHSSKYNPDGQSNTRSKTKSQLCELGSTDNHEIQRPLRRFLSTAETLHQLFNPRSNPWHLTPSIISPTLGHHHGRTIRKILG